MTETGHGLISNENDRLAALYSYHVLDSPPEKEYDAITRLASYICNVPVAFITLLDAERQWFKSKIGTDADEIPRAGVFCNKTIQSDELYEITDVTEATEPHDDLLINGASIRFYAGAPLIAPNGYRLGTLCVIDLVPRKLSNEQRDALRTLADEVMSHLELRRQRRELEESLARHKEFHNLFDNSPDIHFIMDRRFYIEQANRSVTIILGYNPQQIKGQPIWRYLPEEEKANSIKIIKDGLSKRHRRFYIETMVSTPAGVDIKWISWSVTFKDDKWFASGRDITYQKRISQELEQLALVASKVSNGVVISNANDEVIWVNDAFERITGFNLGDVTGRYIGKTLNGKPANAAAEERLLNHIKNKVSYEAELLITRKDGSTLWIKVVNSVIRNNEDEVDKFIRIIIDISARKKIEQDLEVLSFAARKSPGGIFIRDTEGRFLWMNEALENIIGYTFAELEGKAIGTALLGKDSDLTVFHSAVQAVKESRPYQVEMKLYKKDGTPIWVNLANSPIFNEDGGVDRQMA